MRVELGFCSSTPPQKTHCPLIFFVDLHNMPLNYNFTPPLPSLVLMSFLPTILPPLPTRAREIGQRSAAGTSGSGWVAQLLGGWMAHEGGGLRRAGLAVLASARWCASWVAAHDNDVGGTVGHLPAVRRNGNARHCGVELINVAKHFYIHL